VGAPTKAKHGAVRKEGVSTPARKEKKVEIGRNLFRERRRGRERKLPNSTEIIMEKAATRGSMVGVKINFHQGKKKRL